MACVKHFSEKVTFQEFIEHYFLRNEPCLLGAWATEAWGAKVKWATLDGTPNFDYLLREFGDVMVTVADCSQWQFSTHPKKPMTMAQYLDYWRAHDLGQDQRLLYLKDWHFVKEFPSHCKDTYMAPPLVSSDWLNEVWSVREDVEDDYKFIYMGPEGTWTPFHVDVLRSFSWSANILGMKEWLLYPPGEEDKIKDGLGNLPCDVTEEKETSRLRVTQGPGEIIFVPSGWHHQVRNMKPTISLNHNWSNSFCLARMWTHLQDQLTLVQRELEDCRAMKDWAWQCQVVLKASAGMDYWEFAQFLIAIATPRVRCFELLCQEYSCPSHPHLHQLKHFIQKVKEMKYRKTFFQSGCFPPDLASRSIPDCLGLCLDKSDPLDVLLSELPPEFKQLVSYTQNSHLVFRAFEVYTLDTVAHTLEGHLSLFEKIFDD